MDRPAEVCDLEFPPEPHQQVLGLDVPVYHLLTVAVHQRVRQLCDKLKHRAKSGHQAIVLNSETVKDRQGRRKRIHVTKLQNTCIQNLLLLSK